MVGSRLCHLIDELVIENIMLAEHGRSDVVVKALAVNVSVVIPAYGRPEGLALCLKALMCQLWEPAEVIVVVNGPYEPFQSLRARYRREKSIRWLHLSRPNARGSARNLGAAQALGELLIFLDADMIASCYLTAAHLITAQDSHSATVGRRLPVPAGAVNINIVDANWFPQSVLVSMATADPRDEYFRSISWDLGKVGAPWQCATTCNLAVSRAAFEGVGGFDTDYDGAYGYEDIDLSYRLFCAGVRFRVSRFAIAFHVNHLPLSGVRYETEKRRNIELFRKKHPNATVWW